MNYTVGVKVKHLTFDPGSSTMMEDFVALHPNQQTSSNINEQKEKINEQKEKTSTGGGIEPTRKKGYICTLYEARHLLTWWCT
jgi:hypothetical protein